MKTVILAGGRGTRLGETTTLRPKPMVEVGPHPIIHHIMGLYCRHGFNEFVIALGYLGDVIRRYFLNLGQVEEEDVVRFPSPLGHNFPDCIVHLKDTGLDTNTGGRLLRLRSILGNDPFFLTYGDGLSSVSIPSLLQEHQRSDRIVTLTAVHPPPRFGCLTLEGNNILNFKEKPKRDTDWISGGFFVIEPQVFNYISGDETPLEGFPLESLAIEGKLKAYRHHGFWYCMDTPHDVQTLNRIHATGSIPWLTPAQGKE